MNAAHALAAAPASRSPAAAEVLPAAVLAAGVALWFCATTPAALHWFVLPVTICAVLVGGDAVRWLRGSFGAFDPAGVIGLLGVHLFFLAPLLHVRWDYWMRYVQAPPDWRDWLGAMAILNCAGLIAYRAARAWTARPSRPLRTVRTLDEQRFWPALAIALLAAAAAQVWVYHRLGGLLGYVRAFEEAGSAFQGMGIVFVLSESFPILALMGYAVLAKRRAALANWWLLALALLVFFALKILFGGLRGSRSNTVWGLFWALGIIHLWIRPLPRRVLLTGLPVLALFMFGYGLYKAAGLDGLQALAEPERAVEITRASGRTWHATLLGDLGRSDVQAYVLYRVQTDAARDLAWGRTYVGGAALLVPRSLFPGRPDTKVRDGTDVTYGHGTFDSGRVSTRVYGLAGEAMLNVGALGVPFAFLLWGLLVGAVRRMYYALAQHDARRLLLPLVVNLLLIALIGDSDNIVFFLVKEATVPFLVLTAASRPVRLEGRQPA